MIGERALRAILVVIALFHIVTGGLALVAPTFFFDQIGRYGSENSHYVGDVGAFTLAYGIAVAFAIVRPGWRPPVLWLGVLWYGLHALNHAFDVGEASSKARGWGDTLSLAFGAAGGAWLARVSERLGTPEPGQVPR